MNSMNGQPYTVRRDGAATHLLDKFEALLAKCEQVKVVGKLDYAEARKLVEDAVTNGLIKRPKERKLEELECKTCKVKFMGLFATYCSYQCRPSKKPAKPPKMAKCVWCSAEFHKFRLHKTCSPECSNELQKKHARERDARLRDARARRRGLTSPE